MDEITNQISIARTWMIIGGIIAAFGTLCIVYGGINLKKFTALQGNKLKNNIQTLTDENTELKEKIKPENIQKEKKNDILQNISLEPNNNKHMNNLLNLDKNVFTDDDYEIIKNSFLKSKKIIKDDISPMVGYQIILFRSYSHLIYQDEDVWKKFETDAREGSDSVRFFKSGFSDDEVITANNNFLKHCLEFGGIKKNKSRINDYLLTDDNVLLDLSGEFGSKKLYENIFYTINDADERVALFETVSSKIFKLNYGRMLLKKELKDSEDVNSLNLNSIKGKISELDK